MYACLTDFYFSPQETNRVKSEAVTFLEEVQKSIDTTFSMLALTRQSLQQIQDKINEVSNTLRVLQSHMLDLKKEKSIFASAGSERAEVS